uniref:Unkown protein n=1 Tax=Riptortus pedestris TaxID=329032 RepID=R4WN95_RIPPE|nr:unkown protein [Riptortus pedestris]
MSICYSLSSINQVESKKFLDTMPGLISSSADIEEEADSSSHYKVQLGTWPLWCS